MHNAPGAPKTNRSPKFIPILLLLCCAVGIGIGIRYYKPRFDGTPTEAWSVYFSDVGAPNGQLSLEKRLVAKLTDAEARLDAALYHLDSAPIADALVAAHGRGVEVRIVTETRNMDEAAIAKLQAAGIPVVDDDRAGYMHHKFVVLDGRYVWTGSYNTTYNGAYKNDNNVVFIDSVQLAANFTQEFRELFQGARVEKPAGATPLYPEVVLTDGTEIATHFSPKNGISDILLKEVGAAKTSIHFMAFSFTQDALSRAMRNRFESGIDIQGVFEARQVDRHSEYDSMKAAGLSVAEDTNGGAMHHKVIIVDAETVITGSYNFSRNAEENNSENLLIIRGNPDIAAAYLAEFQRVSQ